VLISRNKRKEDADKRLMIKFQFVGEFYLKEYATVRRGFFFVFSGAIFGIRWFESFCRFNGSNSKKTFFRLSRVQILLKGKCGYYPFCNKKAKCRLKAFGYVKGLFDFCRRGLHWRKDMI
jgi:hypothetical protein